VKFFFYLNDVDASGGPFCFVKGSHKKKFTGWKRKARWRLEEMEVAYGHENIIELTANLGDLIVADPNGFHRGKKVVSTERLMLAVDYVIHKEFEGRRNPSLFQLPVGVYVTLSRRE
ncbi:MAG: phytanoyl-CoA dioxygenase family protein, partial [Gammaproteobacteria bacterium]|nr:phytanoyl-CoA dioxygenase family protein [Gammaproteobacteria bacterium]